MFSFAMRERFMDSAASFTRALLPAMALLAALTTPIAADSPRDELLGLVPEDAGFCLIVNDLRGQTEKLLASPWVKSLAQSSFARDLIKTPEARQLLAIKERVQKRLKISLDRLRDDILGDAVVFAYRLGPPENPAQDQGLVLLWARDARLLAQVVDFLNIDLKEVQPRAHKQVKYFRRVEAKGPTNYYYIDGPLLAFSTREEMIREVIDRALERKTRGKEKAHGFLVDQLARLGADKALAVVLLNPRAFDGHIRKSLASSKSAGAFFFQSFFRYWQALEGVALSFSIAGDLEVKVAVKANADKLPEPLRRFFTEASRPSELWGRFPKKALVAVAGRIDVVAFAELLADFLPEKARKEMTAQIDQTFMASLGVDLTQDILPNLGPDIGLCLTAPEDKKALIPLVTGAIRVHPGSKKKKVDRALFNGLSSLAFLAVLSNAGNKSTSMKLSSTMQGDVEVKYLESDKLFPAGVKPAFALKEGYLLLTTSPEAVLVFGKREAVENKSEDVLLLRVSLKAWSAFLNSRRDALVAYLNGKEGLSRETARRQIDSLVWGLDLFDRLELTQRTGSGMATWTLRLKPALVSDKTKE